MYSTVLALIFSSLVIALTGLYVWLIYCVGWQIEITMERRPRKGFSRLDRKKSSELATQQYKVADINPHNYDVFETRHKKYPAKLTKSGKKWSTQFETRSAPVSPKDTSEFDTDEGQQITQQVLQAALEYERRQGRRKGLYRTRSDWDLYEQILPDTPLYLVLLRHCQKGKKKNLTVNPR